ncbi:hypothetical protein PS639_06470 [Pseudomonas fluorescens]|nr:hypothetical protein PS639_06334 [Pseudomonas fluorescens]VVN49525.1 hypothetical protein PS639_06470 [Pseudomonas fluorescens]
MQGRHFGTAGSAHAPGLFQHAAAPFAVTVQPLGDVVVAPRGVKAGVGLIRCAVENLCLLNRQPYIVRQRQLEQIVVIPLHHQQVGPTINLLALPVFGQVLITAITQHFATDKALADAVGDDTVQILLQHHAFGEQLPGIRPGEDGIELVETFDHFLTTPCTGMNRLQADRTGVEQVLRRRPGVIEGEYAETIKHHVAHAFAEQRRPAVGCECMSIEQAVADGFGADEVMVDVTTPQIIRPSHAQLSGGSGAYQGLGRQQIKVMAAVQPRVVTAPEFEPEDVRQPTGQCAIGFDFVQWSVGAHRMGDHQFLAVCWGHASPFNWRFMNVT